MSRSSPLELLEELERLLSHRHPAGPGTHVHGTGIEVREAWRALEHIREALSRGTDPAPAIARARRAATSLHLNEPHRFSYVLSQLERSLLGGVEKAS